MKIVECLPEESEKREKNPLMTRFHVQVDGREAKEIITYNEILQHLKDQHGAENPNEVIWKFKDIIAHEGPLKPTDASYKGSPYNVMVAWEDGSQTFEPLHIIAADDPVTCASYAKWNDLLETPGWK